VRRRSRPRALPLLIPGALLTLLMGALCLWPPPLIDFLEKKVYDSFLRSAPHRTTTGSVTVADLDEASLARLGQWPWPRYRVARLVEKIREGGASAVGLDMVFAEPDRTSLASLSKEIRRDLGASIGLGGLPPEALDTDHALAAVLSEGPFVLGYQFAFEAARGDNCILHPLRAAEHSVDPARDAADIAEAPGVVCNLPVLTRAAGSSGFINVALDPDGVVRRVPLVIRHKGILYPSLALAIYLRARGGDAVLETRKEGVEAIRLDGRTIPLDRRGNLLVNYRGRRGVFSHVSAAAILDGTADPAALKGKFVILGSTAAVLHDIRTTPLEPVQPGIEIHATVLDNLLAGDPIADTPWARGLLIVFILFTGFLLTVLLSHARAIYGLAAVVPSVAVIWLGSWWLLAYRQLFLSPLLPVATLALVFTLLTSLRFLRADREVREHTRKLDLTQNAIIRSLADLAETRHHETGDHIRRTSDYMQVLAMRLQDHPRFCDYLDETTVDLLYRLAPLHDIGKVGVSDKILLKKEALTPEEYEEMKQHTIRGSKTIQKAKNLLGEDKFLRIADEIALTHHEWWDGTGYPHGLKGEEIPIPGRLMAVADSYDAAISPRLYKRALSHKDAVDHMRNRRGTHFDPDVLDAFLETREEFRRIAEQFAGTIVEPEPPKGI
jgi:adenylate cyclase